MNRRTILKTGAVLLGAVAGSPAVLAQTRSTRRVVVIGAGVMGLSAAYHLARLGAEVVVLERERAPGLGCTQGAFAMLIADRAEGPLVFNSLYGLAVLDWRRLQAELAGRIRVQWGGVVQWAAPGEGAQALTESARAVRALGGAAESLSDAQFAELAPGVIAGPIGHALFRPNYGAVDPMEAVAALAHAAESLGVRLVYGCTVQRLRSDGPRITAIETDQGDVQADVCLLAAGADIEGLAETAGVRAPIRLVSGTLAHSRPHPRVLDRVLNSPTASIKQDASGRIVTGLDYRPGADGIDTSQVYGERLLAEAAEIAPAIRGARLERMTLGYVPIPGDAQPIVGFSPRTENLYLLTSLSGITMAPLLGRLAASEIVEGVETSLLAPYRPARFA
jgi:glycine/D-amino acid oxidase-like deaminating enzyme